MEAGVSQNNISFWLTPASMLAVVLSALPRRGQA
jgi:heme/copper-type cytochrome/quinol oxidase subunit 1